MKRIYGSVAALLVAQTAGAGVYVEMVNHNIATNTTKPAQTMYLQDGAGRIVDDNGHVSIIKGNTMYMVDEADKSYVVFDKATMDKLAKKMNDEMSQVKEQLAKLPAEQRAQMEAAMGKIPGMDGNDQKWTVEALDTGKSDKVDGRACKLWDVKRNDELDEQVCVVPFASLPGKENVQAVFGNFSKVFDEMAKSVPMLAGMMGNEFSAHVKTNGYPVRLRSYEDGKLAPEETLMKVWREEAVPASMFEIPAGYKLKQMSMGPSGN
ncbi:MAG: hypothetical protein ABI821_03030 [Pseudomonadota bacterium]